MPKNYINNLLEQNKSIFIFSIFVLVIITVDSTIVKSYGYSTSRIPGIFDLIYYSLFVLIFIVGNYVFLKKSGKVLSLYKDKLTKQNILHKIVLVNQFIVSCILVTILIQMIFLPYYFNIFLLFVISISLISSMFFSLILIFKMIQWLRFKRNKYLLFYVLAFFLIFTKSAIALVYLLQELNTHNALVKVQQTRSMLMRLTNTNAELSNTLKILYDNLSILSYIGIWLTISLMLKKYTKQIGKTKYWILIAIPLISFFILTNSSKIPILRDLPLINPNFYGMVSILLYSVLGIILAILFSFGIIKTAQTIQSKKLSSSLMLAAIGIMIVIGSQEIFGVFVGGYPPYGLVTVSFTGIGSYLLFLGIMISSKNITTSMKIRDDIIKNVENSNLLKDVGITQWNLEIEKHIKKISEKSLLSDRKRDEIDESEVKILIDNIIDELKNYRNQNKKE